MSFETPMDLLDQLLPDTYEYGKIITGNPGLKLTFALNALVAVDNAAWVLYAKENSVTDFNEIIPRDSKPALSCRHAELANIPLISYGLSTEQIKELVNEGYFFLKVKIGNDPEKDGDPEKMLSWDKQRLTDIHNIVGDRRIPYSENGTIPYYLDANGRYPDKEYLLRLLDHADKIGALDRIMILEEPFPEEYKADVSDLPVTFAADESAHSDRDTLERIQLGYKAIALKPIAKTLSMSFRIAETAHDNGIPCFCADLTVNPIVLGWNMNVAARLAPLPGMKIGVIESNGWQNYKNWDQMKGYHPCRGAAWIDTKHGLYNLDEDFYRRSGGIFMTSPHYRSLVTAHP
jgi:L-alanine-DL-glutamate epimerase-like enolase superfamily enzyme